MTGERELTGNSRENANSWIWLVLIVAALLRLNGLTAFSLSNDELSALARLQFDSAGRVITGGVYPDFHPAGVQLFLYYWTLLFGFSEWAVRLPFALMGTGAVYFLYRIGKYWFGPATGLLAAAGLAVLEYPILYSQIARPYSPGLFFTLLAAFFWTRALFRNKNNKVISASDWQDFAGFSLSVSACMYIHYFSFIFAGLLCFSGLFFLKRNTIFPYLVSGLVIVLLYLPHMNIFLHQLSKGGVGGAEGWLGPPGEDAFSKYLDYCFNNSSQLKLLFFIIPAGTILLYRKELKLHRFHLLSLLFFITPFAIAYYYSIYKNPVFQHSVLLFSFPYLLLFLFSFIPANTTGFTSRILLMTILIGGWYSTVKERKYYSSAHFSEFRGIASRVKQLDEKFGDSNITKTISVFDPYYIRYYLDQLGHNTSFKMYSVMTPEEHKKFMQEVEKSETPLFLHAFSNVYDDPRIDMIIRSSYPWLVHRDSMLNSGVRLYSKQRVDSAINRLPQITLDYGFENGLLENEVKFRDSIIKAENQYSIHLTKNDEFGPGLKLNVGNLGQIAGARIEISSLFRTTEFSKGAKLVCSVDDSGKTVYWVAAELKDFEILNGEWFRVFLPVDMPIELTGNEKLNIYLWNEKKEDVWMDDLRVSIYY